jgi:hypothetical protein
MQVLWLRHHGESNPISKVVDKVTQKHNLWGRNQLHGGYQAKPASDQKVHKIIRFRKREDKLILRKSFEGRVFRFI